jgi:hypothetical protein
MLAAAGAGCDLFLVPRPNWDFGNALTANIRMLPASPWAIGTIPAEVIPAKVIVALVGWKERRQASRPEGLVETVI